ncbi:MAG: twin-arginine translocase subunit TatB [Proteobacteria bacterium]|jgi:sec-independent protein translocase protein TatB|nr:twin-arginine translocase subunit TatB [Pseudomonadota bacterium]
MLSIGFWELLLVGVVLLVVVGPERMPKMMRFLGKAYGKLRRAADELRRAFVLEADRMDSQERFDELQQRRQKARDERMRALEERRKRGVVEQKEDFELPKGFTPEEWERLPDHVREIVAKRMKSDGDQ